ncbi:MAG: hypothetical protein IKP73_07400 [Bacteroidales bacterium]|nr:hypothetical protein [Bacteroidales bacterium]MBR4325333.1 hypothetical protein [Bacteroidales bacterium]
MEHNNINLQLLNAVFFLAAAQGKELCYNPNDGCIYQVKARSKADVTLLPLGGGEPTPIFDLNPDTLIFRDDMAERSANIGILTANNGMETDLQQPTIPTDNSEPTASKQTAISVPTASAQNYIGFGKVDLPKFSSLYSGELYKVSVDVENLLDKIFAATNKPQTIEKTIQNYHNAKKFAKNGQIYELKQLAERLQGRIAKQSAMQKGKDAMAAQQQARRKMWISAAIAVIIALVYIGISNIEKRPYTQTETDIQTEFAELSELDKAIMEWERTTGKKIYPKGRECLAKSTKGMTKDQIIRVIQQNVK